MSAIPRRHTNSEGIGIGHENAANKRMKFLMREIREIQAKQRADKLEKNVKFSKPNRPSKKKGKNN